MPDHVYILAAIDGTGSGAEHARLASQPTRSRSSSNVLEFYYDFRVLERYKRHFDGPRNDINTLGLGVSDDISAIITNVLSFLRTAIRHAESQLTHEQRSAGNAIRICLVGHSRGGLIAIEVARRLCQGTRTRVFFLGLFDAVDRDRRHTGSMIHFVDHTFHALRNPYEVDLNALGFGNTGTESTGEYEYRRLRGTHGDIGWDARSSANSWIRTSARRLGLPIH